MRTLFMRAFGRPQDILGKLGGYVMARTNNEWWRLGNPAPRVLEVGFGPGLVVRQLTLRQRDTSRVSISLRKWLLKRGRNIDSIQSGRADLQRGSVESLPFDDDSFDKFHAGLAESCNRTEGNPAGYQAAGGRLALGFTRYSGQSKDRLTETVVRAGFTQASMVEEKGKWFCALATKPQ